MEIQASCGQPSCEGISYPGVYWGETWNRDHIENAHLIEVARFQREHNVPILMGEFGMQFEQQGGVRFLSDHVDIALRHGWHFCLWNFRSDSLDPTVLDFDYEKWSPAYWNEILSWFNNGSSGLYWSRRSSRRPGSPSSGKRL